MIDDSSPKETCQAQPVIGRSSMFKFICSTIFFTSLLSFSLYAFGNISFDQAFEELSKTPVSQFDFRIQLLEYRIKNFKKKVFTKDVYSNEFYSGFQAFTDTKTLKCCDKAKCYKDKSNPKLVICEIFVDLDTGDFYGKMDIKKRVENTKFIYNTILELAKETIHETFESSNLRIIIKREKSLREENLPDDYDKIEGFLISYKPQEETLVIWDNGIPYYQDPFFDK